MMRLTKLLFLFAFMNYCFSLEEQCSQFDFLQRLLMKMAQMEVDFKELQKNVNGAQGSMDASLKSVESQVETLDVKTDKMAKDMFDKINAFDDVYNYTTAVARKLSEVGISVVPTGCPDEWTYFQNSCYAFGKESLQFYDAQKFCESLNAGLVNIEDSKENTFLRHHLMTLKATQHWIGMTDVNEEGSWRFYPSQEEVKYFDWGKHQPNNGRVSNCAAFWESFSHLWVDEPCTRKFNPICEKKVE